MKIFVSLTTTPKRFPKVTATLRSLLAGSVKPHQIFLNVPSSYNQTGESYIVPGNVKNLVNLHSNSITLNHCTDAGPITSLLPTLDFVTNPDDVIVLVHDDYDYPTRFLEILVNNLSELQAPCGFSGLHVDSNVVEETENHAHVEVLQTFAGIAFYRKFIDDDFNNYCTSLLNDSILAKSSDVLISNYFCYTGHDRFHLHSTAINRQVLHQCKINIPGDTSIHTENRPQPFLYSCINAYRILIERNANALYLVKDYNIKNTVFHFENNLDLQVSSNQMIVDSTVTKLTDYLAILDKLEALQQLLAGRDVHIVVVQPNETLVDWILSSVLPSYNLHLFVENDFNIPDVWKDCDNFQIYTTKKEETTLVNAVISLRDTFPENCIVVTIGSNYVYNIYSILDLLHSFVQNNYGVDKVFPCAIGCSGIKQHKLIEQTSSGEDTILADVLLTSDVVAFLAEWVSQLQISDNNSSETKNLQSTNTNTDVLLSNYWKDHGIDLRVIQTRFLNSYCKLKIEEPKKIMTKGKSGWEG